MAVMTDQNRARLPVMAAMAQSGFDCWMQEQEEDRQPEDMRVEAYGEERPEVNRPDGTQERRNRRVDVIFEK